MKIHSYNDTKGENNLSSFTSDTEDENLLEKKAVLTKSHSDNPTISIVIVVFNGEQYLEQTIQSVLSQTYANIEFVIIDGASTDRTLNIIHKYEDKIDFWLSEADEGIYDAWNKALKIVTGDWICFIGADDYFWDTNVISSIVPFLYEASSQDIRYVYGKVAQLTENKQEIIELLGKPWEETKSRFAYMMTLAHCGSFHHRSMFIDHGHFDSTFKIAGDYEFLLREFSNPSRKALFVENLVVVGMRNGGISGSLDIRLQMAQEVDLARKKNNLHSFSRELFFWKIRIRFFSFLNLIFGPKASSFFADFYRLCIGKSKRWSR